MRDILITLLAITSAVVVAIVVTFVVAWRKDRKERKGKKP